MIVVGMLIIGLIIIVLEFNIFMFILIKLIFNVRVDLVFGIKAAGVPHDKI
jgi:hypothetical protein